MGRQPYGRYHDERHSLLGYSSRTHFQFCSVRQSLLSIVWIPLYLFLLCLVLKYIKKNKENYMMRDVLLLKKRRHATEVVPLHDFRSSKDILSR
jgi:hypothetical protein